MRVDLRDGQWAELRDRINHGQDKALKVAYARGKADIVDKIGFDTVLVRVFVRAWHVLDPDGVPVPLEDPDAIDRAPGDIIDDLSLAAAETWSRATVPNPPTPPSSDA